MRATVLYGAGDVRVQDVPDPVIQSPADAIVRVVRAAICGSDLHPYRSQPAGGQGRPMGHEFLGIVEDTGAEVTGLKRGEFVLALGDAHLYLNHLDQAREQLARAPRPFPRMRLNPEVKDLAAFRYEDFTLEGYDPHPAIRAPIAV